MVLTFRKQLTFGLGLLCLLTLSIAALSLWYADELSSYTIKLYRHPYTVTANIIAVDADLSKMHAHVLNSIVEGSTAIPAARKALEGLDKNIADRISTINERFLGDKQWVAAMHASFSAWVSERNQVLTILERGDQEQAGSLLRSAYKNKFAATTADCARIRTFAEEKAGAFFDLTQAERGKALWMVAGAGAMALLLAIVVGWSIVPDRVPQIGC